MAVAFDAAVGGASANTSSHTVGSGSNRYLTVAVSYDGSRASIPSGITYPPRGHDA
jgi:hypothetical protein